MSHRTQLLAEVERGSASAESLLPFVYDELRRLAARNLASERPGQTLDATGLVHEAYLRLIGSSASDEWNGRGHFFGAAAEAMRRILVERARRYQTVKHGGQCQRVELNESLLSAAAAHDEVLAVDEALVFLAEVDAQAAELVKLHVFAGLSLEDTAKVMEVSVRTAHRNWSYARAWLYRHLSNDSESRVI